MKVWFSYGSGHSARLSIVGEFQTVRDAEFAENILEDYVNAAWEERYPDLGAFISAWRAKEPGIEYLGPGPLEFDLGIDDSPNIHRSGKSLTISEIRSHNISGIIKLMLLKQSATITVTGRTGP